MQQKFQYAVSHHYHLPVLALQKLLIPVLNSISTNSLLIQFYDAFAHSVYHTQVLVHCYSSSPDIELTYYYSHSNSSICMMFHLSPQK